MEVNHLCDGMGEHFKTTQLMTQSKPQVSLSIDSLTYLDVCHTAASSCPPGFWMLTPNRHTKSSKRFSIFHDPL
jgi:hypothetical protein